MGSFKDKGLTIHVKDAYRSRALYELVRQKRYVQFGKEATDRTLSFDRMPHQTGRTVDIALVDLLTKEEVPMRNRDDGIDAYFLDYYRNNIDSESKSYQHYQDLLQEVMEDQGFQLGIKKEYWHFELPE